MKIVHFAKFFPPEYGGIESVTEALAEDHSAAGNDVEVVCFSRNETRTDRKGRLVIRRMKVKKEVSSQPLTSAYLSACLRTARRADVVHVHAPNMLAALAVLCLPRRISVVVHWHADVEGKGLIGRLVRPIERAMLRRADGIVATTSAYSEASPTLANFIDRVQVIPIGISDIEISQTTTSSKPPYILFIGRLVPYKGLDLLLRAVSKIQCDSELRVVGQGPLESKLKNLSYEMGISNRVKFLGRVEDEQLQELLDGAAIFCLPSINRLEAFGVVLLEAMRAGRAVVATDIHGSGVPWVNETGVTVPPGNAEALARALDRLLRDPEERVRLGKNARIRFESNFSREVMSDRFLRLYERLLEDERN